MFFLITGTSRGIGKALAEHYINNGHTVIGCSTGKATLSNANYLHKSVDLSEESQIMDMVKFIRREFGGLDVLINNAAINPAIMSAAFLPFALVKKVYAVNIFAPMLLSREAIKLMTRRKFGRIINMSSMAVKHEVAGEGLYTSTKSALVAYTRVLAKEVHGLGITVNVIAPSVIKTDLSDQINVEALQAVLDRNAIKGYGVFEDVINVSDFLVKTESFSITGQVVYLGGV